MCSIFNFSNFHKYFINILKYRVKIRYTSASFVGIFMKIHLRFDILWDFEFFENVCGSTNFCQIWDIVLKLNTNITHWSGTFGIKFR